MVPTTPLKGRLGTNYVPTKAEIVAIQKIIDEVEPQIVSLDVEIRAAEEKRAILASFLDDHRSLLSPIRRMPEDILRSIFSHCLPYDTPGIIMGPSEAPMLLTQICSQWRDVVIKTPTLWSTICLWIPVPPRLSSYPNSLPHAMIDIEVDIEASGTSEGLFASLVDVWQRKVESLVKLTTLWLSRAEGCPLDILFREFDSIRMSTSDDQGFVEEPKGHLLSLLCSRSSQWGQLDLQLAGKGQSESAFLGQLPGLSPQLRSIHVQWSHNVSFFGTSAALAMQTPDTAPGPSFHLMKAASLRHLSLDGFTGNVRDIPITWSNLTELSYGGIHTGRMTGVPPENALALLQCCPNLVQCALQISQDSNQTIPSLQIAYSASAPPISTPASSNQVHLPHLQRFVIYEYKEGPSLTLFESLDLPALTSLGLSLTLPHLDYAQGPPPISLHLLSAQGHRIQHLEFGSIDISVADLVDALKLTTGLTELTVNMSSIVPHGRLGPLWQDGMNPVMPPSPPFYRDKLLEGLANIPSDAPPICPNLTVLKLHISGPSDVTTKATRNLVHSRGIGAQNGSVVEAHFVPLEQVLVRFGLYAHREIAQGNGEPVPLPKRWAEDLLNVGFERRVIKVERRKVKYIPEVARRPFGTFWDHDSARSECY
jgi:F-box-like